MRTQKSWSLIQTETKYLFCARPQVGSHGTILSFHKETETQKNRIIYANHTENSVAKLGKSLLVIHQVLEQTSLMYLDNFNILK